MPNPEVRIYLVTNPHTGLEVKVHPANPVHVSASRGESVVWICEDGAATIQFDVPSPFLGDRFECPRGGFVGSGRPWLGKPGTEYKYTVTVTQVGNARAIPPLDPQVIVDNGG